jgi:hypothetical protein
MRIQPRQATESSQSGSAPAQPRPARAPALPRLLTRALPPPNGPHPRNAWQTRWLELSSAVIVAIAAIICAARLWTAPLLLGPLLAVPPALAGIGATTLRRPLAYGAVSLLAAVIVALTASGATHDLPEATIVTVIVVTGVSTAGTALSARKDQQIANVISVAEAAQRAVLRPLPTRLGPVELGVVYLAAAPDAKVGGDLYDVTITPHGIRLIVGDVRGKGLGAVEVAADVLGMYREVAHEVHTLAELARRLDAGLARRWGQHEEFVTAVLAEIDPNAGRLTIYSCGHPPPILISDDGVTALEVPAPRRRSACSRSETTREPPAPSPSSRTIACSSTPTASPRRGTAAGCSTRWTSGSPRSTRASPRRWTPMAPPCSNCSATTCCATRARHWRTTPPSS